MDYRVPIAMETLILSAAFLLGALLVALALSPFGGWLAVFLEWAGAFLVFMALSYSLDARFTLFVGITAFIAGSLGDSLLLSFNPFGWVLTNYMLFVHSSLGALIGLLLKSRHATPPPPKRDDPD